MEAKTCAGCKHFIQHYVKHAPDRYFPIRQGHCIYPRVKRRDRDTPACEKFRPVKGELLP